MQFNLRPPGHPDTVFLVGAGINEHPWDPVLSALQEFEPDAGILTPERANYYPAHWVYWRRKVKFFEKNRSQNVPPEKLAQLRKIDERDLRARQLCIYGLNISPLDAELIALLQEGLSAHTRDSCQIHLFNLSEKPPEIEYRVEIVCPPSVPIHRHPVD